MESTQDSGEAAERASVPDSNAVLVQAARLQGLCWMIVLIAVAAGVLARSGLRWADPPADLDAHLGLVVPFLCFLAAALVGVVLMEVRRQSRLDLALCWANARLERKVAELSRKS